ncbi:MAG TPA: ATP-dependent DNA helicase UvrD2 [Candidatus Nanopelagicales bacterium]
MPDPVLDGLDPEQRLVAEALSGPVLVHAGAGTGKTRAITHRIAHAVLSGRHAPNTGLAVTFTNRAAGEMRGRLAQLGVPSVAVRTFHAAALSQLRYFWPTVVGGPTPELVARKVPLVLRACRDVGLTPSKPLLRDLAAEIEWSGSMMLSPGDYVARAAAAGRTGVGAGAEAVDLAGIAGVLTAYQEVKAAAHAIDFEDVLLLMVALIGERPDVADQIRRHYRWFTVDEYQDITPAQEALLTGWLGERDDVCVVGDASQTIYSFAGADPQSFTRFLRRWPDATEIRLDRCYRCTPQIVATANAVILAGAKHEARAAAARASGTGSGAGNPVEARPAPVEPVLLRAQRGAGAPPDLVTCADDADEAATVVARIRELVADAYAPRDIAILMRTNAASEPIEAALAEAEIPYVMRGAERFFDRAEVREALVRLRGQVAASRAGASAGQGESTRGADADRPSDAGAARGAGAAGQSVLPTGEAAGGQALEGPLVAETIAVLAGMGWEAAGPATGGASRERWESLAAVVALAAEVEAAGATTLAELVEAFERRAQLSHAPTPDGVTVATLHAAKGLEWPCVFIVGAAEGSLPIVYADTEERIAEERRLFYVGLTRARDRLVVTWALTRNRSGRHREPSRFLAEMRVRGAGVTAGASAAGLVRQGRSSGARERRRRGPSRCRVCGAALVTAPERTLGRCSSCPGSADEALVDRLRGWRGAAARERSVPAYVVCTDLTLEAIAERLPSSREDLLDIPGIGPAKLDLYGEALLQLVREAGQPVEGGLDGAAPDGAPGGDAGSTAVTAGSGTSSTDDGAADAPCASPAGAADGDVPTAQGDAPSAASDIAAADSDVPSAPTDVPGAHSDGGATGRAGSEAGRATSEAVVDLRR